MAVKPEVLDLCVKIVAAYAASRIKAGSAPTILPSESYKYQWFKFSSSSFNTEFFWIMNFILQSF